MSISRVIASLLAGVVGVVSTPSASLGEAGPLVPRAIDTLPGFEASAIALRITDRGEVFGFAQNAQGSRQYFLDVPEARLGLDQGLHDAGPVSEPEGHAVAVNAHAQWAGQYEHHAMMWDRPGGMRMLGELTRGHWSAATDISHSSIVVGWTEIGQFDGLGHLHIRPFHWTETQGLTLLENLDGWMYARAEGVNDRGMIVGRVAPDREQAWRRPILTPGDVAAGGRGVVWHNGHAVDLNDLLVPDTGWTIEGAFDINNLGQIVGVGIDPAGNRRAVVLEPSGNDFNGDGTIDHADTVAFLDAYIQAEPVADVNADGVVEPADLDQFADRVAIGEPTPTAQAFADGGCDLYAATVLYEFSTLPGLVPPFDWADQCHQLLREQWLNCPECWDRYHPEWNPNCYGCDGDEPNNPVAPNGQDGWPGAHPNNPYAPDGGPGGDGVDGGDGGDGGDGEENGDGGDGGNGAPGEGLQDGGDGGNGGNGGENGNGGNGGHGADGGNSGSGGNGGHGGNGGENGNGGNGGHGADGGNGGSGGHGGHGGNGGGSGGDGGGAGGPNSDGGNGGSGGNGGPGWDLPDGNSDGAGGSGGNGGNGGLNGDDGTGGSGGSGTPPGNDGGPS